MTVNSPRNYSNNCKQASETPDYPAVIRRAGLLLLLYVAASVSVFVLQPELQKPDLGYDNAHALTQPISFLAPLAQMFGPAVASARQVRNPDPWATAPPAPPASGPGAPQFPNEPPKVPLGPAWWLVAAGFGYGLKKLKANQAVKPNQTLDL
ncbi:hypothetical protein CYPRO_2198 [Cyclonatronum proteinivorum]|uniref:Uncharacterized protein n=1 Tax=Cyclonatronum proteinivorum TaxID=1457365 RepID=A0A345ULU4_9BACT|nr:hypothetical protein [Cyclonatronum proteinivorum]AXJ01446.1 hypothetical protein CYPRO_2198 [Cyclonatronum proteinivorum]